MATAWGAGRAKTEGGQERRWRCGKSGKISALRMVDFFFSIGERARGNFAVKTFCARGDGKERVVRPGCQVDVIHVTSV